jgi:hypothetical protein
VLSHLLQRAIGFGICFGLGIVFSFLVRWLQNNQPHADRSASSQHLHPSVVAAVGVSTFVNRSTAGYQLGNHIGTCSCATVQHLCCAHFMGPQYMLGAPV